MPVIEYKCPNCGGMVLTAIQECCLAWPRRKDNIEEIPDPLKKQVFVENEVKEYHCNTGAVIVTEPETSATTCTSVDPPLYSATG